MKNTLKKSVALLLCIMVLISVVPVFGAWTNPFDDVSQDSWFYEAVKYVKLNGLFSGTSQNEFSPDVPMSRAMFAVVLASLSGQDISKYSSAKFVDVVKGSWYEKAVGWAYDKGIVSGTSETTYSPDSNITREQICVMIDKYIEKMIVNTGDENNEFREFADDAYISDWAKASVYYMQNLGLVTGKGDNMFDPKGQAKRSEVAQIIMVFCRLIQDHLAEDYPINLSKVDIVIEGLEDNYRILQISDLHMTLTDDTDPQQLIEDQNTRGMLFKNEISDEINPDTRLDHYLDYAKKMKIDLFAMTGDIVDSPSNGNISYLKNSLTSYGNDFLYMFGNHDWTVSWDYQSQAQRNENVPKFTGILGDDEADIAIREYDGFVIIALDNSNNQVTWAQYSAVQKYINKGTPVILMLHIPVTAPTLDADVAAKWSKSILMGHNDTAPNSYTQMFMKLIKSENSTIKAIISGHIHMDHTDRISDSNDTIQYTLGPSYTGNCRIFNIHG